MSAYLAGYFDAKGSISCKSAKKTRKTRCAEMYVGLATSSQRKLLDAIAATYGGRVTEQYHPGQRVVYSWRVFAREAAKFLEHIRPESRLRREEIDLALAFYATVRAHGRKSVTADTVRLRERIREQMAVYKKRRKASA